MKIFGKLVLAFAAASALTGVSALVGVWGIGQVHKAFEVISDGTVPEVAFLGRLEASASSMQVEALSLALLSAEGAVDNPDRQDELKSEYEQFLSASQLFDTFMGELQRMGQREGTNPAKLVRFAAQKAALQSQAQALVDASQRGASRQEILDLVDALEETETDFRQALDAHIDQELKELESRQAAAANSVKLTTTWSYGAALLGIVAALVMGAVMSATIARPLRRLSQAAHDFGEGQHAARVSVRSRDEVGELAQSFNAMADKLVATTTSRDSLEAEVRVRQQAEALALQAQQRADGANQAKSQFLANMSHEIRTPLNAIIGFSEMLQDTGLNEQQAKYAKTVLSSGRGLLGIINDVLDFSKIEANERHLEAIDFNFLHLIVEAVEMSSARLKKGSEVELYWEYPDTLPEQFNGDPTALRQILLNLVSNAIKFTVTGSVGVIVQELSPADAAGVRHLAITVKDTGIGIPTDKIDQVFKKFTQADTTTTRRFGGTGLGLAITRSLVELMGGSIVCRSTLGVGSEFIAQLTLQPAVNPELLGVLPVMREELRGKTVLLVDDNEHARHLAALRCEELGLKVLKQASSAVAAIAWLHEAQRLPDVILSDLAMPGMDGYHFAAGVRHVDEWSLVKLIAVTSDGMSGLGPDIKAAGFDAVVSKPIAAQEFEKVLCRVLASSRVLESPVPPCEVRATAAAHTRVLVAEDHLVNQALVRAMLEKMGYLCDIVSDGQQAIDCLARQTYDIVLMDLHMPVLGGVEATQIIRQTHPQLPIIALTAAATQEDRQISLAAGMNDFLSKPFQQADLKQVLQRWT